MRTSNSIKNILISIITSIITVLIGFISQKIFVICLGTEYLGLNGLYSNILSILAVAEMGFGTAIIYNLYKPVAENDYKTINILLKFYKKIYRIISCVIFLLGLILIPFLNIIVGDTTIEHIQFLFFLSLIEVVISYLLTYKRSILYANQKNYIINLIHIVYLLLLNGIQILFLIKTKNYVIYLMWKILFRIIENIVITLLANKMHKYIKDETNEEIDADLKRNIFNKVKGLIFHNIGGALVQGTDNIIISKMFSVSIVGLYSNYYMIINSINNLITQMFQSLTASVGNLLIENNEKKSYKMYKNMLFLNSWIYCLSSACILNVITPFIRLWMGEQYILPYSVVLTVVINYYIQGLRKTNSVYKNAAGIFYEDRIVPLIEAGLNIIFSIILGKIFGIAGIFMGTIVSSLALFLYSYPIYVYKKIFNRKYIEFFIDLFKYVFPNIIFVLITVMISSKIISHNILIEIIIKLITTFIIINMLYLVIYFNSEELRYYYKVLREFLLLRRKDEK